MGKVMVNESSLTSIGEAIREKNGTTNTYKPSEMAAAIVNIVTGGGTTDFSKLKYVELTSSANSAIPNLTPWCDDFDRVVALFIQDNGTLYWYLRGINTNVDEGQEMYCFSGVSSSGFLYTPQDINSQFYIIDAADMGAISMYYNSGKDVNNYPLTSPFKGRLLMFYEEE